MATLVNMVKLLVDYFDDCLQLNRGFCLFEEHSVGSNATIKVASEKLWQTIAAKATNLVVDVIFSLASLVLFSWPITIEEYCYHKFYLLSKERSCLYPF